MKVCILGFLLMSHTALAGSWYAGPISASALAPMSAIKVGNYPYPYLYLIGNNGLYQGTYVNHGSWWGWDYAPIYSSAGADAYSASASYSEPYIYVAHADTDNKLRLTIYSPFSFGGRAWTTQVADSNLDSIGPNLGTVVFDGKLYIFYTGAQFATGFTTNLLHCAIWDGVQFTHQILDGSGGGFGRFVANMFDPAPVHAPDGFRVYYHDRDDDLLREAYSKNGVNWWSSTLDGGGPLNGDPGQNKYAGRKPAAIVDNSGNVNVFYRSGNGDGLLTAQLSGGKWSFGAVDPYQNDLPRFGCYGAIVAPLVYANTI
jgi:hypothetical protein